MSGKRHQGEGTGLGQPRVGMLATTLQMYHFCSL